MFPRALLVAWATGLIGPWMAVSGRCLFAANPIANTPLAVDSAEASDAHAAGGAPSAPAPASRPSAATTAPHTPEGAGGKDKYFNDPLAAGPNLDASDTGRGGNGGDVGDIGGTVLSLLLVVVLILVVVWVLRRLMPGFKGGPSKGPVRVLGKHFLSPKQQLFLVRIGQRVVVIGAAGANLNQVCQITDKDEIAELTQQCERTRSGSISNSFRALFSGDRRKLARALDGGDDGEKPAGETADRDAGEVREELNSTVGRLRKFLASRRSSE
jgi:flagellar biogenesis protein FliO